MKLASEHLRREHQTNLYAFEILEKLSVVVTDECKIADQNAQDDIAKLIGFFKIFTDRYHHAKEEIILFPALEKAGIIAKDGPIDQLVVEHAQGRFLIAEMSKTLSLPFNRPAFLHATEEYIILGRTHMRKEETTVFSDSDKLVPADTQKKMLGLFEEFEEKIMGIGTHDGFIKMLDTFRDRLNIV
jgi:hemerythrin-like domain-containing protein